MISILEVAKRVDTPIHVRPDPGGWLAWRCAGQPGEPEFKIDDDPLLLAQPIALEPALVADVAGGAKLHHITGPGMPLRLLPEVGFLRWRVDLGTGEVAVDKDSAVPVAAREGFILDQPQEVAPASLLVREAAKGTDEGRTSPDRLVEAVQTALAATPLHILAGVSKRDAQRIMLLGREALLSLDRLAGLVPLSDGKLKEAVRAAEPPIVQVIAGKEMVRYGALLDAFPAQRSVSTAPVGKKRQTPARPEPTTRSVKTRGVTRISPSDW